MIYTGNEAKQPYSISEPKNKIPGEVLLPELEGLEQAPQGYERVLPIT
jgi:hypothetical protein